ncbi:helix-turn-helix domain-containing protein [Mucilaginibacter sp. CAU 1740]|uniref:helix-turn-helix domain-containing protein n=1 Tax=Mucilaginibacter sp. CAU 1740 TaxID=3140365 RepID=UPI00325C0F15
METDIPGLRWEDLKLKGFKVHELPVSTDAPVRSGRRDFYKMGLMNGEMVIDYGGRILELKGDVLFFVNPRIPHSLVKKISRTSGYACTFTETFMNSREMQDSPLFNVGGDPVIPLDEEQTVFMRSIFRKMLAVYEGDYPHKAELIKSCVGLVIHEALRIRPDQQTATVRNGAGRITHLFLDLLERQFPVERGDGPLALRNPQQFAEHLAVHVNYLNRALKEVTGKPTSAHISARIIAEAKALLEHTDWSVADIAYALGFEYPAYFNNYFKRLTGATPNFFRKV